MSSEADILNQEKGLVDLIPKSPTRLGSTAKWDEPHVSAARRTEWNQYAEKVEALKDKLKELEKHQTQMQDERFSAQTEKFNTRESQNISIREVAKMHQQTYDMLENLNQDITMLSEGKNEIQTSLNNLQVDMDKLKKQYDVKRNALIGTALTLLISCVLTIIGAARQENGLFIATSILSGLMFLVGAGASFFKG